MKMKLLATAAASALVLTMSATAQAAPAGHFGGFTAGIDLGYVDAMGQINDTNPNYADNAGYQDVNSSSGILLGGRLGYDGMVDNGWMIGGELNVNVVSAESTGCGASGCADYNNGNAALDYQLKALSSIRARGGYVVDPNALLYAFAGFAYAQVETHHHDSNEYDGNARNFNGYTLGGGAQYVMNDKTDVRFEVAYYDLGKKTETDHTDETFGWNPQAVTLSLGAVFHIN